MDKRYQVFVSSTYADLREERSKVIQTLMEMDCIPAGMELFPAADEEQFEFIKRVIDDCDYYLVIVGGRYGSLTREGISYTEKEYDYAISKGLKVVGFVHENPDDLAVKTDADREARARLDRFRTKVKQGRMVKMWRSAADLPGFVALSMQKTMRTYPAVGWVRADATANADVLAEINELRKRNAALEADIAAVRSEPELAIADLAPLNARFEVKGTYIWRMNGADTTRWWQSFPTWGEIFSFIGPHLLTDSLGEDACRDRLTSACKLHADAGGRAHTLHEQVFQTIKVQLMALGFLRVRLESVGDWNHEVVCWSLTPSGRRALFQAMAVRGETIAVSALPEPAPVEAEPGDFDDDLPF